MTKIRLDTQVQGTLPDSNSPNLLIKQPTYTTTETSSKGGLLINIDSAVGDVARTTDGWIEDEKHGVWFENNVSAVSGEFDSAVKRTGKFTIKLSATDATGRAFATLGLGQGPASSVPVVNLYKHGIVLKPNTKYKLSCWVKTNNTLANSTYISLDTYNTSGTRQSTTSSSFMPVGTNDWTLLTVSITSGASVSFGNVSLIGQIVAGNICDAWFDINSMKLEEIIETTNDNLTSKEQGVLGFTAIGSTDNIDQSLDTGGAYANTYTLATSIVESATTIQEFVPTKAKLTRIGVLVVNKGTGNWTMTLHNSSNVVQSSVTIENASLTNGAFNYFNVPAILTAGATYHFHLTSTVADGTVKTNTASDLNTCSYIQQYYKPTTAFNASLNGETIDLRADEDGFGYNGKVDLVNNKYTLKTPNSQIDGLSGLLNQMLAYSTTGLIVSSSSTDIFWRFSQTIVYKFKIPNYKYEGNLDLIFGTLYNTTGNIVTYQYSYDNITYYTLQAVTTTGGVVNNRMNGVRFNIKNQSPDGVIYIKWINNGGDNRLYWVGLEADIDTSSIKILYNYPTNKSNKQTYVKTLTSATTTAIYRATKYGFPAIEFSNGEYQFLKINCEATDSVVKFSADGVSYTTVTDGGSIALSSTTLPIIYTDITITKNRLLMASNDYNNSADKDGSLQAGVVSQNKVQGLVYDVQDLQKEMNILKQAIYALQNP